MSQLDIDKDFFLFYCFSINNDQEEKKGIRRKTNEILIPMNCTFYYSMCIILHVKGVPCTYYRGWTEAELIQQTNGFKMQMHIGSQKYKQKEAQWCLYKIKQSASEISSGTAIMYQITGRLFCQIMMRFFSDLMNLIWCNLFSL